MPIERFAERKCLEDAEKTKAAVHKNFLTLKAIFEFAILTPLLYPIAAPVRVAVFFLGDER